MLEVTAKVIRDGERFSAVAFSKPHNEGVRGTSKAVDGLVIIPDRHDILVLPNEQVEQRAQIRARPRSTAANDPNIFNPVGATRGDTTGVPFVSGGQAPRPTGQPAPTTPGGKVGRVASTSIPGGATERSISVGRTYPAATSSTTMTTAPEIDYDRLTSAMLLARPVHGDVHISGDPSEYRRQMQKDEQAAGLGGRPVG